MSFSVRDILGRSADPTPGKYTTDSNRFPGHAARMESHIHRIRTHQCERVGMKRCSDCIRRQMR